MTFFSKKTLRLLLLPALLLLTGCAGSSKETADSQENTKALRRGDHFSAV